MKNTEFTVKMLKKSEDRSIIYSIKKIEDACFSDPWTLSSIEKEFDNKISQWFIAYKNDVVAGYLLSWSVAGECDLLKLAVDEENRCKGVGRRLLESLIRDLRENDCEAVHLEVRESNVSAIRLYESVGFSKVGFRKDYYPDNNETALLFTRILK